jgi:hypothetical protein
LLKQSYGPGIRWRDLRRILSDAIGPATITITGDGRVEICLGVLQAGLDIEDSRSPVGFTRRGLEEADQVSGGGSAEMRDDGSIEIEFAYHNGDRGRPQSQTDDFFNSLLMRDWP